MAVERGTSTTGVVERSFHLLQTIVAADGTVGVRELARRTGLARSTVSRLLATLEDLGMVDRTADGSARPGSALATLVPGSGQPAPWDDLLRPLLGELVDRYGEAAAVSIDDGEGVLYMAQVSTTSAVRVPDVTGERHEFHLVAPGLALMGEWGDDRLDAHLAEPLSAATQRSVTDPDELRRRLVQVRADGHVWAIEELDDEVNGLATLVRRGDGAVAAISIFGPAHRLSPEVSPDLAADFCALVAERSAALL